MEGIWFWVFLLIVYFLFEGLSRAQHEPESQSDTSRSQADRPTARDQQQEQWGAGMDDALREINEALGGGPPQTTRRDEPSGRRQRSERSAGQHQASHKSDRKRTAEERDRFATREKQTRFEKPSTRKKESGAEVPSWKKGHESVDLDSLDTDIELNMPTEQEMRRNRGSKFAEGLKADLLDQEKARRAVLINEVLAKPRSKRPWPK